MKAVARLHAGTGAATRLGERACYNTRRFRCMQAHICFLQPARAAAGVPKTALRLLTCNIGHSTSYMVRQPVKLQLPSREVVFNQLWVM